MSRSNRFRNNLVVLLLLGSATVLTIMLVMASCGGARLSTDPGAALLARSGSGAMSPWRMFGANSLRTRLSEHTGPPTNKLKWMYATKCNINYSSPAIAANGTIYIGDTGSSTQSPRLYAISASGKVKWTYETIGILDSPALSADDSTIYVGAGGDYYGDDGPDWRLYAISSSGSLRWTFQTGDWIQNAPVVGNDGMIYIASLDHKLYAIHPDGSLNWSFDTGGEGIRSSPAIGSDGTVYFGVGETYLGEDGTWVFAGRVYALNADGSQKWDYPTGGAMISCAAIGSDGTVYIGCGDSKLYAINEDGTLKWTHTTDGPVYSSPGIGPDGAIYVGGMHYTFGSGAGVESGNLRAINPDGSLRWVFEAGSFEVRASPAIGADGTVYAGDTNGFFFAVNPNGTEKWSYALPGMYISSPAIGADGTVYVGSNGPDTGKNRHGLFAFGPGLN